MLRRHWIPVAFALLAAAIVTVAVAAPYLPRLAYEGFPKPVWPAPRSFASVDGVEVSVPTAERTVGPLDPQLEELLAESNTQALLVSENGSLRLERYADGVTTDTRFNSYSLVKSLVGAPVLRAIAEGKFTGLDQPIGVALPDIGDESFRSIPLRSFLEMRSGVLFEAGSTKNLSGSPTKDLESAFSNPFGPLARLHMLGLDAVGHSLSRGGELVPPFSYQNINTAVLGAALERAYGRPLGRPSVGEDMDAGRRCAGALARVLMRAPALPRIAASMRVHAIGSR